MTNRQYILNNPEEMRGIVKKAREYIEKTLGYHHRMIMTDEEMLDKWLEAEHEENQYNPAKHSRTYIANIALTIHDADRMNIDEARQIAQCVVSEIKRNLLLQSLDIDDVTTGKIQTFEI